MSVTLRKGTTCLTFEVTATSAGICESSQLEACAVKVTIQSTSSPPRCRSLRRPPTVFIHPNESREPKAESRKPRAESREPKAVLSDSPKLPGSLPVLEEAAAALAIERVPLLAMPIADAADVALEIS